MSAVQYVRKDHRRTPKIGGETCEYVLRSSFCNWSAIVKLLATHTQRRRGRRHQATGKWHRPSSWSNDWHFLLKLFLFKLRLFQLLRQEDVEDDFILCLAEMLVLMMPIRSCAWLS